MSRSFRLRAQRFGGGYLGIAFVSPFSNARYFWPWRPVQVSPIGLTRVLSAPGVSVLISELVKTFIPRARGGH